MNNRVYLSPIKQEKQNCAQTCLAMLSGHSIREIEILVGRENGLSLESIKLACMLLRIPIVGQWTSDPWKHPWGERQYPVDCILYVRKDRNATKTHVVICQGNMIYDPNGEKYHCGRLYEHWEFLEYLEFQTETLELTAIWHSKDRINKETIFKTYIQRRTTVRLST